ncbi:hypothetical protein ACOME3_006626 [Neoechinorhynchus agilis]
MSSSDKLKIDSISSVVGSGIVTLFVTPFDYLKTRQQAQVRSFSMNPCIECRKQTDTRTISLLRQIVFNEGVGGIRNLWTGITPSLLLHVPTTAIYFMAYHRLCPRENSVSITTASVSGGLARFVAATLTSPVELMRTVVQSLPKNDNRSLLKVFMNHVHESGYRRTLFRGWVLTLLRDIPFSMIYWPLFEILKIKLDERNGNQNRIFHAWIGGFFAGSVSAILTCPVSEDDCLFGSGSTFKQCFIFKAAGPTEPSIQEVIRKIYVTRGVSGFYAGIVPRLMKVAPACAIMISTFEYTRTSLEHEINTFC